MTNDFEDTVNLDQMDDADIAELVRQRLDDDPGFDIDAVGIEVRDGAVAVEGRVGTEGERQHVTRTLAALGATASNNVVVDENARATRADAADDARAEAAEASPSPGESGTTTTDTAYHLQADRAGDQYGTTDPRKAVERGQSYSPPDEPQLGVEGDEQH